jgi:hypothetical protein
MNIKQSLNTYGIKSFYHFTDRSNLDSILKYGLQSLYNIYKNKIPVSRFGANVYSHSRDMALGLHKFVHLSFIPDHPMYHIAKKRGSIIDPIWLEIDISVLFDSKIIVSNRIANAHDVKIVGIDKIFDVINFNTMLYSRDFYKRNEARKAEIMVYDFIPSNKIIAII